MNTQIEWAKQLDKVYAGGVAVCPVCGSKETNNKFYVFEDGVGFGDFECQQCGAKEHLCRLKYPEDIKIQPISVG